MLDLLRQGWPRRAALAKIGVRRPRYGMPQEFDSAFEAAMEEAEADAEGEVAVALFQAALSGNIKAADEWRSRRG